VRVGSRPVGPGFNWGLIVPVSSGVVGALGLAMLVCAAHALVVDDGTAQTFGVSGGALIAAAAAAGTSVSRRFRQLPLRTRDTFLAVTLAWLAAAAAGAIPFMVEGTFPRFVDAMFESMSGFTTTGATLLDDVDAQPDSILLWRSLSQWLGGVGIVVLVVGIAPAAGLGTQRVFHAETSGVTAERLTPRIAETAKIIWGLYLGLTAAGFIAYTVVGMDAFDAINHVMTSVASGGFSTHTASLAAFDSTGVEMVAIVLMIATGVNYAFYWRILRGRGIWPQASEVRAYLLIIAGSIAALTLSLEIGEHPGGWRPLRDAAFSVSSVITTTGYTTADFDIWNDFARAQLVLLMIIGGCAGSTAGGVKVIRVQLLAKTVAQELSRQLRPRAVFVLRTRGKVFSEDVRRSVLGFFVLFAAVGGVGTMAMLVCGLDLLTAVTSVAATLTLVGPGLGQVGASENFQAVPEAGRAVLTFLMLAGRLEIFTVLVLLTPAFWRRNVA